MDAAANTSTPSRSVAAAGASIRPYLVLPLSCSPIEMDAEDNVSAPFSMSLLSASLDSRSLPSSTPVCHVTPSPNAASPSNSNYLSSSDLLSSSSAELRTMSTLSLHAADMTFTSAFSLRHRRGKTLILPKLKIPRNATGSAHSVHNSNAVSPSYLSNDVGGGGGAGGCYPYTYGTAAGADHNGSLWSASYGSTSYRQLHTEHTATGASAASAASAGMTSFRRSVSTSMVTDSSCWLRQTSASVSEIAVSS